jgi:peptide-methionine (R)-S-oxide reductase
VPKKNVIFGPNGMEMGKLRVWPSIQAFKTWRNKHLKQRRDVL